MQKVEGIELPRKRWFPVRLVLWMTLALAFLVVMIVLLGRLERAEDRALPDDPTSELQSYRYLAVTSGAPLHPVT